MKMMNKSIAILTAGLFAGAAFAQTSAPTTPTAPDSSISPAVAKAQADHEKRDTKAHADGKHAKVKARQDAKAGAAKDGDAPTTTGNTATPTTSATPVTPVGNPVTK